MQLKTTAIYLSLLLAFLTFLGSIPYLLRHQIGMPSITSIHDAVVQQGQRPSGKFGWKILQEITKNPHPYNSDDNQRVLAYLIEQVKEIQTDYSVHWGCLQPSPFEIFEQDDINMMTEMEGKSVFFESSNFVTVLKGTRNESLLISSHYDSASQSHGATDAGVGIASMISVLHAVARHACFHQLDHSIIFNFNNGEEIDLLGAMAFTLNPLFKSVKAFINLEGTGVSANNPSFLFRSNSFPLVSLIMANSPFPHSSIIANNMMRLIRRYEFFFFFHFLVERITSLTQKLFQV